MILDGIIDAIAAAVATVPALTGKVTRYGFNPRFIGGPVPRAHVSSPPRVESEHGPSMSEYLRRVQVPVLILCGSTPGPEARQEAAITIASAVMDAIEADRSLGGLALDLIITASEFSTVDGSPGLAAAVLAVEVSYYTTTGL